VRRNEDFAADGAYEGVSIVAKHPVYVITCLDPRTDPSAFLELELGDAMVIRNAGGRVSPDVLKDLAYIGYLRDLFRYTAARRPRSAGACLRLPARR